MNRLFGTFFDTQAGGNGRGGALRRWIPAMDLVEEGDRYVLRADLPGVREQDVKVELDDNVLSISGERRSEHEDRARGYYRVERASGSFSRSLVLPDGVDPQAIHARIEHGVLEISVPKPAQRTPHRVAIDGAANATQLGAGQGASDTHAGGSEGAQPDAQPDAQPSGAHASA
ncbi:MAG TPA: Hsp20/alpha crystallin family protein [Solirubrobacteraceae bacterium]|nr:Hsp20/alpha crystallin family protein [Solirubrobacteraceae bacterium]